MPRLLFLHGYGRPPRDYAPLLDELRQDGFTIHAPFLFGNHGLAEPPLTVAEAYERTLAFLEAEGIEDYCALGHSTGGGIALLLTASGRPPRAVSSLCPIRRVEYGWPAFVLRSLRLNGKHWLGLSGAPRAGWRLELETGLRYNVNMLRKPGAMVRFLQDLVRFDLPQWLETPSSIPVQVVHAQGDEFFDDYEGYEEMLRSAFSSVQLERLDEPSHEYCLLKPAQAASAVRTWLRDVSP